MRTRQALFAGLALQLIAAPTLRAEEPGPIQDNSFLVEEAYNQEAGVVQHIGTFNRVSGDGDWLATFTQEWPLRGVRHQLSYSLPLADVTVGSRTYSGLGDIGLNYRLQLVGDGKARIAFAPRFSVLLPTGSAARSLGAGRATFQLMLPASTILSRRFVAHWNAGAAFTPSVEAQNGAHRDLSTWNAAQSLVWLARPRFNVLVETAWNRVALLDEVGTIRHEETLVVSPGVRFAHDSRSGLQVVPGIAFPVGLGPSSGEHAVFLYLSFEHPFGHRPRD